MGVRVCARLLVLREMEALVGRDLLSVECCLVLVVRESPIC